MPMLNDVRVILRSHEPELRGLGAAHAAVFSSVARGEATDENDIDILLNLLYEKIRLVEFAADPNSHTPTNTVRAARRGDVPHGQP